MLRRISLLLIASLLFTTPCFANTTTELRSLYGVSSNSTIDPEVIHTLRNYEETKKVAVMYNNLMALSHNDIPTEQLKVDVKVCENNLRHAYGKSFDDIVRLEENYLTAKQAYSDAIHVNHRTVSTVSVDLTPVTTEEYKAAQETLQHYQQSQEIGTLSPNGVPVQEYIGVSHSHDATTFTTDPNQLVRSIYNGTVTDVSSNSITISDVDDISVKYKGLTDIAVDVGDTITQSQPIGLTTYKLFVGIDFNGDHRNIKPILKEAS